MTKIGADVNVKPADPGSAERGVVPPVVLQPVPEKVNISVLITTPPNQTIVHIKNIQFVILNQCGLIPNRSYSETFQLCLMS